MRVDRCVGASVTSQIIILKVKLRHLA
jgi:hypothetical protein